MKVNVRLPNEDVVVMKVAIAAWLRWGRADA
jgi:hypothetical protein